jgi:hypothetical protein
VIGKGAAQAAPDPARAPLQGSFVTVKPGETLFRLAERHLGNGNRWRQLRKADGTPYTEADLPHVKIGEVVLLPDAPAARADTRPANRPAEPDVERLVAAAPPELQPFAKRSIPVIVKECLAQGVTRPAQIAYVLATAEHECKCGQFMTEIWGPTDAQISYEGRRNLGNTVAGDGYRFRGRGYVQVTGRSNYKHWADKLRLDLVGRPDIVAKDPAVAAAILVRGMKEGSFCNRRLDEFIDDRRADFVKARDIINADRHIVDRGHSRDRGTRIAEIAERYFGALRT